MQIRKREQEKEDVVAHSRPRRRRNEIENRDSQADETISLLLLKVFRKVEKFIEAEKLSSFVITAPTTTTL